MAGPSNSDKMSSALRLLTATLALVNQVAAHTWIEQMSLISPNGTFIGGNGYSRGYVPRTASDFKEGLAMQWLVPSLESERLRINPSDHLCHYHQRTPKQSPGYPRLKASPGSYFAMKYLENGHVTEPANVPGKPPRAGTAFVYGTTEPKEDEKLVEVLQWNRAGTGGDGRGHLITAQNFDDGRCHQINSETISEYRQKHYADHYPGQPTSQYEQWCETDVQVPQSAKPGTPYTIYWVWQWPTKAGTEGVPEGKDEYYTTCSDLDIVPSMPLGPNSVTLEQQDPQSTPVPNYKHRPAITPICEASYLASVGSMTGTQAASLSKALVTPAEFQEPPVTQYSAVLALGVATVAPTTLSTVAAAPTSAPTPPAPTSAPVPTPAPSSPFSNSSANNNGGNYAYTSIPASALPGQPHPPPAPAHAHNHNAHPHSGENTHVQHENPSPNAHKLPNGNIIMTAYVPVVATLTPEDATLIVVGSHSLTFKNPQATAATETLGTNAGAGKTSTLNTATSITPTAAAAAKAIGNSSSGGYDKKRDLDDASPLDYADYSRAESVSGFKRIVKKRGVAIPTAV